MTRIIQTVFPKSLFKWPLFFIFSVVLISSNILAAEPSREEFNIKNFGAIGDGKTLNTRSIQEAIDSAFALGGGQVYVPSGVYLSGTLFLKSNVSLYVSAGATILGSPNIEDYAPMKWGHNIDRQPYHLIVGDGAENIQIMGQGTIDGNGPAFWKDYDPADYPQWILAKDKKISPMMEIVDCKNVTITDVTLKTGGGWTLHIYNSELVKVDRINILNDLFAPNGDGIDITGSSDVTVSNCIIKTCDDAICLKTTGDSKECKRVVVSNNVIECSCAALKIGNESFRDIAQVTFSNNVVYNSSRGFAIYAEGGGTIEDITVSNLIVDTKAPLIYNRPIQIMLRESRESNGNVYGSSIVNSDKHYDTNGRQPAVRNILIQNVVVKTEGRIMVTAEPGREIENITFRDIQIDYPYIEDPVRYIDKMKSNQFPHENPAAVTAEAAFVIENVKNLVLENIHIDWPQTKAVPEEWAIPVRIANGSFSKFTPDYSNARQTEFSVLYGRGIRGGYIDTPLAESSSKTKQVFDLKNSSIKIRKAP